MDDIISITEPTPQTFATVPQSDPEPTEEDWARWDREDQIRRDALEFSGCENFGVGYFKE